MANRAREKADISAKFDVHFNEDGSLTHEVSDSASVLTRKKRYVFLALLFVEHVLFIKC